MIRRIMLFTLTATVGLGIGANGSLSAHGFVQTNRERDSARATAGNKAYLFNVYYNDKLIGTHEFRVMRSADEIRVFSSANFVIKVLFIPIYRYKHVAEERWLSGCLRSLVSSTNDNGRRFKINLGAGSEPLLPSKLSPTPIMQSLPEPCAASYAYWDLDLLRREALINAQTGDLASSRLLDLGVEDLDGIPVRRFILQLENSSMIELWYRKSDSEWIALETLRDGGKLSYRAQS